ncbi:MAG: YbaK/EbsC family protein [Patescibacteria group bacterium]|jgi:prolyl-tRNA editing enzyme YbaK/EbsC (Cys-tRNA(Pro) deacylase)
MTASKKILLHLGKRKVKFEIVKHKKVYTAYDLAQTLGEKLDSIAKTLLVEVDLPELHKKGKNYFVAVVPASYYVDLANLKKVLKAKKIALVPEKIMAKLGLRPGALTPFGSLRGLGVVLDKGLVKTKEAIVGAESFTESLRLKVKDLMALENPVVGAIGKKSGVKLQKKAPAKAKKPAKRPSNKKKLSKSKKRR